MITKRAQLKQSEGHLPSYPVQIMHMVGIFLSFLSPSTLSLVLIVSNNWNSRQRAEKNISQRMANSFDLSLPIEILKDYICCLQHDSWLVVLIIFQQLLFQY
jgi:hypothetical protein